MALNNYFETLKLTTGACEFTLVEDRAVRSRSMSPQRKEEERLRRDTLVRTSALKFTMDECDEPLFCPTRQLSSGTDMSLLEFPSIDSMEALNAYCCLSSQSLSIDDSNRSCGSDHVPSAKTADSRWAFPKHHDYPIHSRVSTGSSSTTTTRMQTPYARRSI